MAPRSKRNGKIDEEIEETFPASDPPAFMGGEVLGAPKGRKTPPRQNASVSPKTTKSKRGTTNRPTSAAAGKKKRATKKRSAR